MTISNIQPLSGVPLNTIMIWSGSISSIPAGWVLCDGANGTPDLRDRFVYGVGNSSPAVNTTGGSTTKSSYHLHGASASTGVGGAHSHTYSNNTDPSTHTHTSSGTSGTSGSGSYLRGTGGFVSGSTNSHSHSFSASLTNTHNHSASTSPSASDHSHASGVTYYAGGNSLLDNMPPYYALAFVMKI